MHGIPGRHPRLRRDERRVCGFLPGRSAGPVRARRRGPAARRPCRDRMSRRGTPVTGIHQHHVKPLAYRTLLLIFLLPAAFAACNAPATTSRAAAPAPMLRRGTVDSTNARVEVLWDDYGVPHIFAQDAAALFYAFGWAQMRSHADLILRLY